MTKDDLLEYEREETVDIDWEPVDACRLRLHMLRMFNDNDVAELRSQPAWPGSLQIILQLYNLTRKTKPAVYVETGVQNGGSTEAILGAMHQNDKGMLYSVDSANESTDGVHGRTWNEMPGQYIMRELKYRWDLRIGLSQDVLPELLEELGEGNVDIFFHDDDHSKENVQHQFDYVRKYIKPGGFMAMHDYTESKYGPLPVDEDEQWDLIINDSEPRIRLWQKKILEKSTL